jgi:hypothetical protein
MAKEDTRRDAMTARPAYSAQWSYRAFYFALTSGSVLKCDLKSRSTFGTCSQTVQSLPRLRFRLLLQVVRFLRKKITWMLDNDRAFQIDGYGTNVVSGLRQWPVHLSTVSF